MAAEVSAPLSPAAAGPLRVLVATAVAAERDAVTAGFDTPDETATPHETGTRHDVSTLPGGYALHRVRPAAAPGGRGLAVDVLAAGVGPAAAAAGAASALTAAALAGEPYDLVVSAGIGGGFAGQVAVGGTVVATEIVAADLGAETADGFTSVTDLGFGRVVHTPPPALVRALADAAGAVTGPVLTASTVTGTAARAGELAARHPGAVVEAMEGFGVAEAAAAHDLPVLEVRTVSNPVGPRDRDAWRIPEALRALTTAFRAAAPVLGPWPEGPETHKAEAPVRITYSPCPNDTFVFDAWAHGRVPGAPELDVTFADIDVTNALAVRGEGDVLKVSYAVLPWVLEEYALLPCGGALGRGCGPLVLSRTAGAGGSSLTGATVAVPSERSTAYLLFRLWAADAVPGGVGEIVVLPFHEIMPAVRDGRVDAGLVIHEARFTYGSYGLHCVADLGEHWEHTTGLPIPLGAIIARRSLGPERLRALAEAARTSVRLAWDDPEASRPYVREHAQEMDPAVADQHIGLYVNEYTADLGESGYAAVRGLLTRAAAEGLVPPIPADALRFP
ncbi:futalosine hydrolase [Streptomyces sp. RKND-216]|nr:futalosine hydrolase [Streptomyces sp. RKND-216]